MIKQTAYDVIIVGGGMVGATLACALGNSPLRILLLEAGQTTQSWQGGEFENRVSAITRASQRIFETLGVWQGISARRISPFREMEVWDSEGSGRIHFDAADLAQSELGHIIENSAIQSALWERLPSYHNVETRTGVQIKAVNLEPDMARIQLVDGQQLQARLLVGADGGRSWVRDQVGIEVQGWSYGHHAIVATVQTELPHQETAWQRFLPTGPLAFLPLADGSSSIVWSTTPEQAEVLMGLDDADFATSLAQALGQRLGAVTKVGPRAAFPLTLRHAREYVRPRLALVGDAAHTIHPLAGQGVNLGLADVAVLAETLCEAARRQQDPGDMKFLRRYERWRRADNSLMIATMEGFKRLFGNQLPPVKWLRNFGLTLTHRLLPVKNSILRQAMGMEGELSRLAQGKLP